MLSLAIRQHELSRERPLAAQERKSDRVGRDGRRSEALHAVVVDEAVRADRVHRRVQRRDRGRLDVPQGDDELVALELAQLEGRIAVPDVADADVAVDEPSATSPHATSSAASAPAAAPACGTAAGARRSPDVVGSLHPARAPEAHALDRDGALVLCAGHAEVACRGEVEVPAEGRQRVVRLLVDLVEGEVDVRRQGRQVGALDCERARASAGHQRAADVPEHKERNGDEDAPRSPRGAFSRFLSRLAVPALTHPTSMDGSPPALSLCAETSLDEKASRSVLWNVPRRALSGMGCPHTFISSDH